jgi:uracil-DNA glycosylase family 4
LEIAVSPHLAESLWNSHEPPSYPKGVLRVPEAIPGISFFPGGYGLWRPDISKPLPPFPVNEIMVLGHDFHSEVGYWESVERGRESPTQPTWVHLLELLDSVGISRERCFFTNIYMGLREGSATTGRFPGADDAVFVAYCERFLVRQLISQRPRLIITLGKYVPPFLAKLSDELNDWRGAIAFKQLDSVGSIPRRVRFRDVRGIESVVAPVTHPCYRQANVRHRRYRRFVGEPAERMMLIDAVALAFGGSRS